MLAALELDVSEVPDGALLHRVMFPTEPLRPVLRAAGMRLEPAYVSLRSGDAPVGNIATTRGGTQASWVRALAHRFAMRFGTSVDVEARTLQRFYTSPSVCCHTVDRWCTAIELHPGAVYGWEEYMRMMLAARRTRDQREMRRSRAKVVTGPV